MSDLRVPPGWAEEYCRVTEPGLFQPSQAESTEIVLAYLPKQRWLAEYDAEEVCADLADGVVVQQRGTGAEPFFRLGGSRFDVFVQPRVETGRRVTQAFVSSVKPARGQGRTESVRPKSVRLLPVWDAPEKDLAWLAETFAEGARVVRRRRVALDHARRGLTTTRTPTDQHTALHAAVRRHYQPLQLMLRLLEQRSTLEGTVAATGTAAQTLPSDDGPQLWIELAHRARFAEGRPIGVTMPDGTNRRLRVIEIDERTMVVAAPREAVEEGTPLRLEQQGRFTLSKHSAALRAFLDEQVEGSWTHLAQLLCQPSRLPIVDFPAIPRFYHTDLNAEQQSAVRGAVGSPHAFFVQGPPGTGKTTVITEVVQQLLARGERVLLLAPMHVAVDEVLGRVADQPGVLALRISWDDARVHPDLQKYLPERAARTYLRQARRPDTSRAARWQEAITALTRQVEVVTTCLGARAHRAQAADLAARAEQSYQRWAAQAAAAITAADHDVATGAAALLRLRSTVAQAAAHAQALRAQVAGVPRLSRAWANLRSRMGLKSDIGRLITAAREAETHHTGVLTNQEAWATWHADAQRRAGDARKHQTTTQPVYRDDLSKRRAVLAAAERALEATAAGVRTIVDHDPGAVPDGELAAVRDRLAGEITRRRHWIDLEGRWFAVSGLAEQHEQTLLEQVDADLRRSANLICCTTTGVNRDLGDSDFDTLIVDEASRVIDSEFLIGAVRARRWVLVGDERQLPPYVEPADEHHLHALSALRTLDRGNDLDLPAVVRRLGQRWQEDEEIHQFRARTVEETAARIRDSGLWQRTYRAPFEESWTQLRRLGGEPEATLLSAMLDHLVRSLFERTVTEVPAALRQPLLWQRRMVEPIAELVRVPIYGGEYRTPPGSPLKPLRYGPTKTPMVFVDTSAHGPRAESRHVGNGFVNDLEADLIVKLCQGWERRLRSSGAEAVTVSVLTFYRAQAVLLRKALGGPPYRQFRQLQFQVVDAIDKIQGQEADLVFLSFCRTQLGRGPLSAQYGRWLQDVRRLNVACTRARRGITMVGHAPTLRRLNGVPAAQAFYRNLFQQAADRPADMQIVSDAG